MGSLLIIITRSECVFFTVCKSHVLRKSMILTIEDGEVLPM